MTQLTCSVQDSRRTTLIRALSAMFLIAACALSTGAIAQKASKNTAPETVWPNKPVRILVGFPGGSTPDMAARTLAEPLSKVLGQPAMIQRQTHDV